MYHILSQSVEFCRLYIRKHVGVFFGSQCIERKLSLTKVKPGLGAFFVLRHPVGKWIGTILQLPGRTGPIPSRFIDLMSHVTLDVGSVLLDIQY